jgi:RNA-dependent RNA polymerase
MNRLYTRIKEILLNGAHICDRKYEFLAFSSSQLREHSCWMFASVNSPINAERIRNEMGNFSNVRPVAKLAARVSGISNRILYIFDISIIFVVRTIIFKYYQRSRTEK